MAVKKATKKTKVVVKDGAGNKVEKEVEQEVSQLVLKAPDGMHAFTHSDGTKYTVDDDGTAAIDPAHVSEATQHGFTDVEDDE